jgi:SAM-dependent methyltransferase
MKTSQETRLAYRGREPDGSYSAGAYRGLAGVYDDVMGDAVFPLSRKTFESAIKKYGITFSSAADIGCGTGTFLKYLGKYGVPLFGVDLSQEMLAVAARKTASRVRLIRQDIRELALPVQVDLITCNFDTFNYLTNTSDLSRAINRCRANLTRGGHLIFDVITGGTDDRGWQHAVQEISTPNADSRWDIAWSPRERLSVVKISHEMRTRRGLTRNVSEVHRQRWYPLSVLKSIVKDTGLETKGIHEMTAFSVASCESFWIKYIAGNR